MKKETTTGDTGEVSQKTILGSVGTMGTDRGNKMRRKPLWQAVALTAVATVGLSACVMPGSDDAKNRAALKQEQEQQQKAAMGQQADGASAGTAVTPTSGPTTGANATNTATFNKGEVGIAPTPSLTNSITSVKVQGSPLNSSTMELASDYVILTKNGDGTWSVLAQNADQELYRHGTGRGGTMPLSTFFASAGNTNGLRTGYQVVNSIITGRDEKGNKLSFIAAIQQPTAAERGVSVRIPASPAYTGTISAGLMDAAGEQVDANGNVYVNSFPDNKDITKILLSNARVFMDNGSSKMIGECLLIPGTRCVGKSGDLYRSDLTGLNLSNSDFTGSNLSSSTMRKALMDGSIFKKAQIFRSDASGSSWVGVNMDGANAHQITLTGSKFDKVSAIRTNLFRAEMDNITSAGSNYSYAMMQQITMRKSQAGNSNFSGANLFRAEISGSDFTSATFGKANMAQVIAQRSRFTGVKAAGADMSSIDLRGADASNADLRKVQLAHATLKGTNFSGANLSGAILFGADINGANFSGANIQGMTCPNGEIIGKTYLKRKYYNKYWKRYMGQDQKLKMCRPVYQEVKNTTAENSGVVTNNTSTTLTGSTAN